MANVIATSAGFFDGKRIREGQKFDVPEGAKGKWFKPAKNAPEDVKTDATGKKKANGPQTFRDVAKADSKSVAPGGPGEDLA